MSRDYYDPQSYGTEAVWKHPLGLTYNDGVRLFAMEHEAIGLWT